MALALGAAASHLLPTWSVFSDSLWSNRADAFTWAAVVLEVGMSLVFAFSDGRSSAGIKLGVM